MSLDVFRKIFNSIDNHFTTRDLPLGLPLISGVGSFVKLLTATIMMIGIVKVQISVPFVDIQQLKSNKKKVKCREISGNCHYLLLGLRMLKVQINCLRRLVKSSTATILVSLITISGFRSPRSLRQRKLRPQ